MSIAQWKDELSTGVNEIDNQHKELINLVNSLHASLSQGKGKEVVDDAVRFLANYVVEHFKNEEGLMLKHKYIGYPAHKREHENFVNYFNSLVSDYNAASNTSFLAINLQRSVVDWLVNHIMKVDKEMAKFVMAKAGSKIA
ncbi:MAG: bacteriohemerythrin [Firmicutes bacterium]|nr:bacteriohemerythrin [Bacillota bacterium]